MWPVSKKEHWSRESVKMPPPLPFFIITVLSYLEITCIHIYVKVEYQKQKFIYTALLFFEWHREKVTIQMIVVPPGFTI